MTETYVVTRTEYFKRQDLHIEAAKWLVPHCGEARDIKEFEQSQNAHDLADQLKKEDSRDLYMVTIKNSPHAKPQYPDNRRTVKQLCWNQIVSYRPKGDEDRPQLCAVDNDGFPQKGTKLIGLVSGIYWYPKGDEKVTLVDREKFNDLVRVFENEA